MGSLHLQLQQRNDTQCAPANGYIMPAGTKKKPDISTARREKKSPTAQNAHAGASTLPLFDRYGPAERPDVHIKSA